MKKNEITLARILLALGVLSIILTIILLSTDSYELLSSASVQNYKVSPLLYLGYILLSLAISAIVYFNVKSLKSDRTRLKRIAITVGITLIIFLICYFMSSGNEFSNKNTTSDFMAQLIEAGLRLFYLLLFGAVVLIFVPILKKIKKD